MITKSFVANYVSVHDSITLTKMTNCCKSTGQINMTRVVLGLNISWYFLHFTISMKFLYKCCFLWKVPQSHSESLRAFLFLWLLHVSINKLRHVFLSLLVEVNFPSIWIWKLKNIFAHNVNMTEDFSPKALVVVERHLELLG